MSRINLVFNVEQLAVGVLSVIALLVIETQSQVTGSTGNNYIRVYIAK